MPKDPICMRDLIGFLGEMVKGTLRIDCLSPNSRLYFAELRETLNKPPPPGRSPQKLQIGKLRYLSLPPAVESLGRGGSTHVPDSYHDHLQLASLKPLLCLWLHPFRCSSLTH